MVDHSVVVGVGCVLKVVWRVVSVSGQERVLSLFLEVVDVCEDGYVYRENKRKAGEWISWNYVTEDNNNKQG